MKRGFSVQYTGSLRFFLNAERIDGRRRADHPTSSGTNDEIPTRLQFMNTTIATSFADPADIRAYLEAKMRGETEEQALDVGDNGIGCWGDDTKMGSGARSSLPAHVTVSRWGSMWNGRRRLIRVFYGGTFVDTILSDAGPGPKEEAEGHGLDLNYDAWKAFGVSVPAEKKVQWDWLVDLVQG